MNIRPVYKYFFRFENKLDKSKKPYMESIFKAVANNYRIRILVLVNKHSGMSVDQISQNLDVEYNTIAVHIRILNRHGLIYKKYTQKHVCHYLTKEGKTMIQAINLFYKIDTQK